MLILGVTTLDLNDNNSSFIYGFIASSSFTDDISFYRAMLFISSIGDWCCLEYY